MKILQRSKFLYKPIGTILTYYSEYHVPFQDLHKVKIAGYGWCSRTRIKGDELCPGCQSNGAAYRFEGKPNETCMWPHEEATWYIKEEPNEDPEERET